MILRLQLQIEVDTESRKAVVVDQVVGKETGRCIGPCGGRKLYGRDKYCSRDCRIAVQALTHQEAP